MYYRKNKFGESIEVYKYECGSCSNYDFLDERGNNYCNHYHRSYGYRCDCQKHWELSEEVFGDSGCFLTTACCQYKGLPNDCNELQCLRKFRDDILLNNEGGVLLVHEYYKTAPEIVRRISVHNKRGEILESIYCDIKTIEKMIMDGNNSQAIDAYVQMVLRVQAIVCL